MADYKKMYGIMFNAVTDAIEILAHAQQKSEEEFLNGEMETLEILKVLNTKEFDT